MMHEKSLLPVGERVDVAALTGPRRTVLTGEYVELRPLDAENDAAELFRVSHGTEERERLWTYMSRGPFEDCEAMRVWLESAEQSTDPLFFSVLDMARGQLVGMVSFLNIVPGMGRLEVGNIWYAPEAQRTRVNTEATYLLLRHGFDELGYRRVEWKCDALNERSRRAALRLGFAFEGIFRQHMVVKGRNRDTAWYAMLDGAWPAVRRSIETWLDEAEAGRPSLSRLHSQHGT